MIDCVWNNTQALRWIWSSGHSFRMHAQVQFLWASEEINRSPDEYWTLVMDVARRSTLARVRRCSQIMGRDESDDLSAAQVFYPCMQCADVFYLKVRAAQVWLMSPSSLAVL